MGGRSCSIDRSFPGGKRFSVLKESVKEKAFKFDSCRKNSKRDE